MLVFLLFLPQESFVQNIATGDKIFMVRKNGVFVMELDDGKGTRDRTQGMEVDLEGRERRQIGEMVFVREVEGSTPTGFSRQA